MVIIVVVVMVGFITSVAMVVSVVMVVVSVMVVLISVVVVVRSVIVTIVSMVVVVMAMMINRSGSLQCVKLSVDRIVVDLLVPVAVVVLRR
jgi:hypothetical protein